MENMALKIICDTHTHTAFSPDCNTPIEEMVLGAVNKGIRILNITDHCNIATAFDDGSFENVKHSVDSAKSINRKFENIEVLSGIEIGDAVFNPNLASQVIKENPCDVIIGSVHTIFIDGRPFVLSQVDFGEMGKSWSEMALNKYFDNILEILETAEFDVLAHLTYLFRYINGKYKLNLSSLKYEDKITKILKEVIKKGVALEINTSCKESDYDEFMPEEWIINLYKSMGGYLITCGSDAHFSEKIGHSFNELFDLLIKNGFKNIYYYKNRTPMALNLE